VNRSLKAAASRAQESQSDRNRLDALGDLLTTEEAAARLRYTGPRAVANFFLWANRHRVPRLKRGARVLWQTSVLAAYLTGEKWTRKHAEKVTAFPARVKGDAL
jgi:hypothetical protein